MAKTKYPSKADKAQALIDSGAVRLFPGRGYATVIGSTGNTYTITRQDGCNCPNSKSRDPRSCYHAEAARILCGLYHDCAKQARETGRVRIPPALYRALGGYRDVEASPPPAPIPAGALVDEPTCDTTGHEGVGGATRCAECDVLLCRECWQYHRCGRSDYDRPPRIPAPADCRVCGHPLTDWKHSDGLCPGCWTATRRTAA